MANKYVAVLLVACLVMFAGVEGKTLEERQQECFSYCWHSCIFPTAFCNSWCRLGCQNPIMFDSLTDEAPKYPVPTEKDYLNNPHPSDVPVYGNANKN
ncbi:hypothetical protein VNO78_06723 [Psophocarpus tetragonolobus]|uniref:Transmembrane protein n=1 Tax=Psophocarpus tetragonolobus TaxID=3891 RepID=A0AAN9SSK8_PSOTE